MTRLAVDKIEEVTVDGKTLYKVTAKAPDLVQHTNGNELSEEYVHYFAKPKFTKRMSTTISMNW